MLNRIIGHTQSCDLKELGMPLERCAPDVYHIEVFEGIYRREYRQPMIWEALDWLQSEKNICIYTYRMTQGRKLALRKADNGVLIKDIPLSKETSEEDAYIIGIRNAIKFIKSKQEYVQR